MRPGRFRRPAPAGRARIARLNRLSACLAAALVAAGATAAFAARAREAPAPTPRVTALLLNGGGNASANYQSHLTHLRLMVKVLREAGVPERRITILSGDGPNPAADVALRETQPEEDFWRLSGTRLEGPLKTPITYESTSVPGFSVRAATGEEIDRWFRTVGSHLVEGDTLLFYVTDHGTKNDADLTDNRITLWGRNQGLSVGALRTRLAKLDPRVRVVMLMSQCFSGSFTNAAPRDESGLPAGNVCGYFSTTAERPAYGCYAEVRDQDNTGHSFDFIEELAQAGRFPDSHLKLLQTDATPDAPLRTSDAFLEERLRRQAGAEGIGSDAFVDGLLARAWRRKGAFEPEIRLLDAIGRNFGTFSPRSLAEIREQEARLPEVGAQLDTHAQAWQSALADANRANLGRFLAARPGWADLTSEQALRRAAAVRELSGSLLFELAEFTRSDAAMSGRLATLRSKAETARALGYRMDVREGVMLRMRMILTAIAGREYLAHDGSRAERAAYEALVDCESLRLPLERPVPGMPPTERAPFPAMEDDIAAARDVLPAWLGIRFADVPPAARQARGMAAGAASVLVVYPDSPAEAAGLMAGDVILGPPAARFEDPRQIREWTMLSTVDVPATLAVVRGGDTIETTIIPKPWPMKWPDLPGPPRVSARAPAWKPLQLSAYRGDLPEDLRGGGPHLLFFWATWCGPCKASLPEVLAFARERDAQVVAITDEEPAQLDRFFARFEPEFPPLVAIDARRDAFLAYGVSGTPTFVLVDGAGVVRGVSSGYTTAKGLQMAGWQWSDRPAPH
jgi:thiol-disulfide isomerase/thioredoxin